MDGWMDGWVDGWVDGWMNGWVDGWMLFNDTLAQLRLFCDVEGLLGVSRTMPINICVYV